MLRYLLLTVAVLSLFAGLWSSWDHFLGNTGRSIFLTRLYWVTAIWFVCATAWAYLGSDGPRASNR